MIEIYGVNSGPKIISVCRGLLAEVWLTTMITGCGMPAGLVARI